MRKGQGALFLGNRTNLAEATAIAQLEEAHRGVDQNLERFWLGGAAHKRRDECTDGWDRAGEPKTCWTKAAGENLYGDCFEVPGIGQS